MKIYQCIFCGKKYKKEKSFQKHSCIQLQRFMYCKEKDYLKYWKMFKTVYKINYKENPDNMYYDMINSKIYNDIISFFDWCEFNKIKDVKEYMEFTKLKNIPSKMWKSNNTYTQYIKYKVQTEHPLIAKERTEKFLKENNVSLNNISQNFLYFSILNGDISCKYLKNIGFDVRSVLDSKQLQDIRELL